MFIRRNTTSHNITFLNYNLRTYKPNHNNNSTDNNNNNNNNALIIALSPSFHTDYTIPYLYIPIYNLPRETRSRAFFPINFKLRASRAAALKASDFKLTPYYVSTPASAASSLLLPAGAYSDTVCSSSSSSKGCRLSLSLSLTLCPGIRLNNLTR